ncbi:GTP-binding protein Rhes-like [Centruroides vittatus]|uniref:GTP-binding protein Rhes-like n=1 Tax=Centruroides vittatus TaxID=120091 RepID=UPI00350F2123
MPSTNDSSVPTLGAMSDGEKTKDHYRIVVMGAAKVGKTAIVQQFLYDRFPLDHKATVEELHREEYEIGGCCLTLDILDTSGSYEFPAMRRLAISTGDGFVLVYSVDSNESFEEVRRLRELVLETRASAVPMVIVGNKCDVGDELRVVKKEIAEIIISIDWENGFVECSAKEDHNIMEIFKQLLVQAKISYDLSPAVKKRRSSLPHYPTSPSVKDKVLLKRNSCAVS